MVNGEEGDLIEVVIKGAEDDKTVQIRAPRMNDAEIDALQAELADLFGFPEMKPPAPPPSEGGNGADSQTA